MLLESFIVFCLSAFFERFFWILNGNKFWDEGVNVKIVLRAIQQSFSFFFRRFFIFSSYDATSSFDLGLYVLINPNLEFDLVVHRH